MMNYKSVIANAAHYIALGQTTIYIENDGAPWEKATSVEIGSIYRLSGPAGFSVIAKDECGITFKWCVDFEGWEANGSDYSQFDRDRLRMTMMKLPKLVRRMLAELLATAVLPEIEKHSLKLRECLNKQIDSEDCVRGLIEFARSEPIP